jgi:curved DNA-binding protein CbpA
VAEQSARTPKPVAPAPDLRAHRLEPWEGLLLTRIDGVLTEAELADLTGTPEAEMRAMLDKLAALGLISLDSRDKAPPRRPSKRPSKRPASSKVAPPPRPIESDDQVELTAEQRARILDVFARLGTSDHYTLLGVDRACDKKAVKRAYFELTSEFHTDRFFRRRLGTFKAKMEAIFKQITEAHDVLTDKAKRADYDAYLGDREKATGIESMLKDVLAEMAAAEQAVKQAAGAPAPISIEPVAAATPQATPTAASQLPPMRPPTPSSPSLSEQARKEALARRLFAGRAPVTKPNMKTVAPAQKQSTEEAMDALKRRYEERVSRAREAQAKKYTGEAEAALARKDSVAAANAFRVALSMTPDDAALKARAAETQQAANAILADNYTRQATYEEKADKWAEAASSWQRVAKARASDAHAHDRAAHCIVRATGDLHEAARLALVACSLDATNAKFRLTLANVYLAAGLTLNAKRELEAAAQLSPTDDTIQELLKRVAKS